MTNETQDPTNKKGRTRIPNLKNWRAREGLTQRQAATVCGIHQAAVCRLEREDVEGEPLLSVALKIERATKGKVKHWALLSESQRRAIYGERGRP